MSAQNGKLFSLPVSRGSAVDSELAELIKEFPGETDDYIKKLYATPSRAHQQPNDAQLIATRSELLCKNTHYQDEYYRKAGRPRSTKRPPMSPRDPNPPIMDFNTWQRSVYVPKDVSNKTKPISIKENKDSLIQGTSFECATNYQRDYIPREIIVERNKKPNEKNHIYSSLDKPKFQSMTTNKEEFPVRFPHSVIKYGDLPVMTGSLLYPTDARTLKTTSMESFPPKEGKQLEMCKAAEPNLKMEGKHEMDTTHRLAFQPIVKTERVHPIQQNQTYTKQDNTALVKESQSKHDFPGYCEGQPRPPGLILPKPPTIHMKFDDKGYWNTEQRDIFQGHDICKHPLVESFKTKSEGYKKPDVKFEGESWTHSVHQPINISEASNERAKAPTGHDIKAKEAGTFEGTTTSKDFFKDWGLQPLQERHGDFHEAYKWVPPVYPLNGISETKSSYKPKNGRRPADFKPESKRIDAEGIHDFRTVYSEEFAKQKPRLTRQQAAALKQTLSKLKEVTQLPKTSISNGIALRV